MRLVDGALSQFDSMNNKKLHLSLFLCLLSFTAFGQNSSIDLGPDLNLAACNNLTTITATTSSNLPSTASYNINSVTYAPEALTGTDVPENGGLLSDVDDRWSDIIPIPFNFCFFDNIYNECIVGSNGLISFNSANANGFNNWGLNTVAPLPNATFTDAMNAIMAPYHDIDPSVNSTARIRYNTFGTAPNRRFVVSWIDNPMFSCNNLILTQQIVLHEGSNNIKTFIANKPLCTSWNSGLAVHGIQNSFGTVANIVPGRNLPNQWTATNDGQEFAPSATGGPSGVVIDWYDALGNLIASNVPSININPSASTFYYAIATFTSCGGGTQTAIDTVFVDVLPLPEITNIQTTEPNCNGESNGSISFDGDLGAPPYNYTLNGTALPTSNANNLNAGTYTIVITDADGCTNSTIIILDEPDELILTLEDKEHVLCKYQNTGRVLLSATGGTPALLYAWNDNLFQNNPSYDYMTAGNHTFYVQDDNGCLDSIKTDVLQPDSLLSVNLTAFEATCLNKEDGRIEAIASGGEPPYFYEWQTIPVQSGPTLYDLRSAPYLMRVIDDNGCLAVGKIVVEQQLCCNVFVPTAFTPNGDGLNDRFRMLESGGGAKIGSFEVFNRWGQRVFSSQSLEGSWDGSFNGIAQDAAAFYYVVTYQCTDENGDISQQVKKGEVILIR